MQSRLRKLAFACFEAWCVLWTTPALADHVVVKRNVTFHEGPARSSAAIAYPRPGDQFQLLDQGHRDIRSGHGKIEWTDL